MVKIEMRGVEIRSSHYMSRNFSFAKNLGGEAATRQHPSYPFNVRLYYSPYLHGSKRPKGLLLFHHACHSFVCFLDSRSRAPSHENLVSETPKGPRLTGLVAQRATILCYHRAVIADNLSRVPAMIIACGYTLDAINNILLELLQY